MSIDTILKAIDRVCGRCDHITKQLVPFLKERGSFRDRDKTIALCRNLIKNERMTADLLDTLRDLKLDRVVLNELLKAVVAQESDTMHGKLLTAQCLIKAGADLNLIEIDGHYALILLIEKVVAGKIDRTISKGLHRVFESYLKKSFRKNHGDLVAHLTIIPNDILYTIFKMLLGSHLGRVKISPIYTVIASLNRALKELQVEYDRDVELQLVAQQILRKIDDFILDIPLGKNLQKDRLEQIAEIKNMASLLMSGGYFQWLYDQFIARKDSEKFFYENDSNKEERAKKRFEKKLIALGAQPAQ